MILNGISKIENLSGKYLILVDYGREGLAVVEQFANLEDAIRFPFAERYGEQTAIVKLVEIEVSDEPASS